VVRKVARVEEGAGVTRVAFVTNLCPHYRRPLFELLANRFDIDFYFHSVGDDRYWSRRLEATRGDFSEVELCRIRILGQPLLPGLATRLTRDHYDVVVKCLNGRLMVPYVFTLARARRLPIVLWTGMWYHPRTLGHRLSAPLTRAVYRAADAVVVYGTHVERHLTTSEGVDAAKIFVAGQAVSGAGLHAVAPERSFPSILFIGQLEKRKGIRDLLSAFSRLPADARLRIVGSGSLERVVRDAARSDHRIEVVGHVPQTRLPDEFSRARCLVLPSVTTAMDREPWGLVVNEAMTSGLPVVSTDAVGAAAGGLIVDGRNGFVVPEQDTAALAAALRRLISDPRLAAELGAQARIDVASYTFPRMAEAFSMAIDYALAGKLSPRGVRRAA
jgi:glycosyltransferase involved in cell wall biosynthesis